MRHADLKFIQSNEPLSWSEFEKTPHPDPLHGGGWFTVEVGEPGDEDSETFQVRIIAAAAVATLKHRGDFRCVVVETFEPPVILDTLRRHLAQQTARDWPEIREKLRRSMWWEWETFNGNP